MKFENPMMAISMFEVENVVTESAPVVEPASAEAAVNAFIANQTAGTAGGYKIVF
jgi:hypothetical protein